MPEAAVDVELAAWLSKIDLKDMAGPLSALGVETMKQLQVAVQRNFLSAEKLEQHGARSIPAVRFMDEAKVRFSSVSDRMEVVGCTNTNAHMDLFSCSNRPILLIPLLVPVVVLEVIVIGPRLTVS